MLCLKKTLFALVLVASPNLLTAKQEVKLKKTETKLEPKLQKEEEISETCQLKIFGTDNMQFVDEENKVISSISVPNNCPRFLLDFKYKGVMPARIMGHNIIITETDDKEIVRKEAESRKQFNYLPSSGSKVLAASEKTLGGDKIDFHEEKIIVDMSKFDPYKSYLFFCSFPGHAFLMKGSFIKEKSFEKKDKDIVMKDKITSASTSAEKSQAAPTNSPKI